MNIWAYVDGFNLYNGALKNTQHKWLDLHRLMERLRPTDEIGRVKFFTAQVDARHNDPDQPKRQRLYWRALRTLPTLEIVEGHFLTKSTTLPTTGSIDEIKRLKRAGQPTAGAKVDWVSVYRSEEKGTDVNLAVHLVHDAHLNRFDAAIVVSNDSDLAGAIRIVTKEIGKPVFVFYPHSSSPSHELRNVATRFKEVAPGNLETSQLPSSLTDARGNFSKPPQWSVRIAARPPLRQRRRLERGRPPLQPPL